MREIKFRFYDSIGHKLLIDEKIYSVSGDGKVLFLDGHDVSETVTALQYTGLRDRNGAEIYEGDIIKYKRDTYPVEHHIYSSAGYSPFSDEQGPMGSDVIIVGNIYENSELLEKLA